MVPSSRGISHLCFWSVVPYRTRVSMFPVSGALQLKICKKQLLYRVSVMSIIGPIAHTKMHLKLPLLLSSSARGAWCHKSHKTAVDWLTSALLSYNFKVDKNSTEDNFFVREYTKFIRHGLVNDPSCRLDQLLNSLLCPFKLFSQLYASNEHSRHLFPEILQNNFPGLHSIIVNIFLPSVCVCM